MHFGQFNLMGYRTPGTKAHELYDNAIEQVKAAEANGFEIAWFAEHHFSNYCVCPSPLMMLARLAGETKRIKLGSAVVVTPLYQPVRLISEIGMVDALTHGRLVLGVGSGYQPYEFERFGEDARGLGAEAVRDDGDAGARLHARHLQLRGQALPPARDAHRLAAR